MSRPAHVCIRDDIRSRLGAGEGGRGMRLPSGAELAARYGVARMTIRQAVGALASEGAVVRRQGLGMFAGQRPVRSMDLLLSFTEEMHQQGYDVETSLITAAVRRVRLVDGCPAIVQRSRLPYARVRRAGRRGSAAGRLAVPDARGALRGAHGAGKAGVRRRGCQRS